MSSVKNIFTRLFRWDYGCTAVFFILCFLHYFSQRPLWLDEDLIYQCVAKISYSGLFNVLPNGQVFPRVQLFFIKFFSQNFAYHLLAVRLFSLAAMLCAAVLWRRIYQKEGVGGTAAVLLMLSFACSYRLTYYAAELKPYAMDVCVMAVYLLYFQSVKHITEKNFGRFLLGSIILPLLLLFSYTGWLAGWVLPFNFLLLWRKEKFYRSLFAASLISTAVCFAVFYYFDLQYNILQPSGVGAYWQTYFLCSKSISCFIDPFGDGIKKMATYWYGTNKSFIRAAVIFVPFFLYGLFRFGVRDLKKEKGIYTVSSLGLVLFAEIFILALLQKYPFTGERVTLFFAPFVFYFIIRSIEELKKFKYAYYVFSGYYFVYCLISLVNTFLVHLALYGRSQ